MAIKFIKTINKENLCDNFELELSVSNEDITHLELTELFEQFLKGCGYVLDGRHLELVDDEVPQTYGNHYESIEEQFSYDESLFDDDEDDFNFYDE